MHQFDGKFAFLNEPLEEQVNGNEKHDKYELGTILWLIQIALRLYPDGVS